MRSQFPQAVAWIDKIRLHKWSYAYDGGQRYIHMTTNLAECVNSVLKRARSLPICALLKITFQNINAWFVERGLKADSMLRASHQYPEDVTALLQQNHQKSAYCHVQHTIEIILNSRCKRYRPPINIGQNQSHSLSD